MSYRRSSCHIPHTPKHLAVGRLDIKYFILSGFQHEFLNPLFEGMLVKKGGEKTGDSKKIQGRERAGAKGTFGQTLHFRPCLSGLCGEGAAGGMQAG